METDPLSEEAFCQRIAVAVAEAENVQPNDLPPLGNTVDINALQTFLQSSSGRATAQFQYQGQRIRVKADGRIFMSEPNTELDRFLARCNTCGEEKRDMDLETAQDFFADHADQRHAVEMERIGEIGLNSSGDGSDSQE